MRVSVVQIEINRFLVDLCVVREPHWVPDKGQEAKMNELEEIQSRTCFNQRLDIFFSFGSGAAILLEALNRKRQAVGRRASVVIQGRSQLSQEERQKERAARRIPQCAIRQSARSHTGQLAPKRHTWRKRQSHRLSHLPSPSCLCQLSRVFAFSAFFLSFVSLPASFPLIRLSLSGFCCIAKVSRRLVIVTMGRFALLSLALASIFTGGLAAVSLSPMRALIEVILPLPCLIRAFLHRRLPPKKLLPPRHL
jgi:hypothetical protein